MSHKNAVWKVLGWYLPSGGGCRNGVPVWLLSECCWERTELRCGSIFGLMLPGRMTASSHELGRYVGTLLCCDKVRSPSGEGR